MFYKIQHKNTWFFVLVTFKDYINPSSHHHIITSPHHHIITSSHHHIIKSTRFPLPIKIRTFALNIFAPAGCL